MTWHIHDVAGGINLALSRVDGDAERRKGAQHAGQPGLAAVRALLRVGTS